MNATVLYQPVYLIEQGGHFLDFVDHDHAVGSVGQ